MKSPIPPHPVLKKHELEPHLVAYFCPESKGYYLPATNYWRWLSKNPGRLTKLPVPQDSDLPTEERDQPIRLCPESNLPMIRYRVGHGFDFSVDRSPSGGIWLDYGEWEALRDHNFHDELHLVFAAPWQNRVRLAESEEKRLNFLEERLGTESYHETLRIQNWLREHPQRGAILAFLQHD